jgi:CheY-like chemotaxis protein
MAVPSHLHRTSRHLKLLCIDDQAAYLPVRKAFLESHGYQVLIASSGRNGLEILRQRPIDGVILDYRMPDMDGGEVALEIRRTRPDLPIIMLSGFPQEIPPPVRAFVDVLVQKGRNLSLLLAALETLPPNSVLKRRPPTASKQIKLVKEATTERRRASGRRKG